MIGLQVGQNIAKQGFTELDPSAFALAVQDALNGTPPRERPTKPAPPRRTTERLC